MNLLQTKNIAMSGGIALGLAVATAPLDGAEAGLKRASAYNTAKSVKIALPLRNPTRPVMMASMSSSIALPIRVKRRSVSRRMAALSKRQPARAIDSFRRRLKAGVSADDVDAVRRAYKGGSMKAGKSGLLKILRDVKPRGLPIKLAAAVITVESAWKPHARGSSGEYGLMQLMPATARHYAPSYVKRLSGKYFGRVMMQPRMNMRVGTKVLHWCYKRAKGNVPATIGCYNRGPGKMWQWSGNHITKRYVDKVRRLMSRAG